MPLHNGQTADYCSMKSKTMISDVDETTALTSDLLRSYQAIDIPSDSDVDNRQTHSQECVSEEKSVLGIISVLMIGVFISQADTSLVLATYSNISSDFNSLESGSWLLSSYMLAMCVSQPIFGKLSDIYGRKRCLQTAYVLFGVGTLACGLGRSMGQVITARAIQGSGGAGMVCMVSILLTDLLPFREVALYRSYVNVVQTLGRSCGGVFGGFLASTIGWRWAFLVQVPPTLLSVILVQWKLDAPERKAAVIVQETSRDKFARIDFLGAIALSATILSALFVLDTGGQKYPWQSPIIWILAGVATIAGISFCLVEKYYAKEPIFPIQLLTRYEVITSYTILTLQNFSQTALMFIVPVYFQVTKKATAAEAGAFLIPAVIGNAIGGLLTGTWIKRTGTYKIPTMLASASSTFAFVLLSLLWKGNTSKVESFIILPAGFAVGMSHSAVFVGLTSSVKEGEVAIAGSGLYLSGNIGGVTGVSAASALYQLTLQAGLANALLGREGSQEILRKATSDIGYIQHASCKLRNILVPAYVAATHRVFLLGLVTSGATLLVASITRERSLIRKN